MRKKEARTHLCSPLGVHAVMANLQFLRKARCIKVLGVTLAVSSTMDGQTGGWSELGRRRLKKSVCAEIKSAGCGEVRRFFTFVCVFVVIQYR